MDFSFTPSSRWLALTAAGVLSLGVAGCSDSGVEAAQASDGVATASITRAADTAGPTAQQAPGQLAQADTDEKKTTAPAAAEGKKASPMSNDAEATDGEAAGGDAAASVGDGGDPAASIERAEAPEAQGTVDMEKLLQNDNLPDMVLGSEDAPVTIVEYASMTCGHCKAFHEQTFPKLNEAFIQTGKVRFVLREFPFDPRATAAFMLARCSGDRYFPVVDVLFDRQDVWARAENGAKGLFDTVKIAGFTEQSFDACLKDQTLLDNINAVRERASKEFGVEATPTFFIDGKKYAGAMSIGQMATLIDQAAAEK